MDYRRYSRTYTQRRPDNFHLHLRSGAMLDLVLPHTIQYFGRALIMPNKPVITNALEMETYRQQIVVSAQKSVLSGQQFKPLMTIIITPYTTPEMVVTAHQAGAIAGKVYPLHTTTGSEHGVKKYQALYRVFAMMEKLDMVLCLHPEIPLAKYSEYIDCQWEYQFIPILEDIVRSFKRLRVVVEHVTSEAMARTVQRLPKRVGATITLHHLELTHNDVISGKMHPHAFCMPVAKWPSDRRYLLKLVLSGNPKFWFGSDSAPHDISAKECADCCAGLFTEHVTMPRLLKIFDKGNARRKLSDFTARFGAEFYGLSLNDEKLTLIYDPWQVPARYETVVPYLNDQMIEYRVAA